MATNTNMCIFVSFHKVSVGAGNFKFWGEIRANFSRSDCSALENLILARFFWHSFSHTQSYLFIRSKILWILASNVLYLPIVPWSRYGGLHLSHSFEHGSTRPLVRPDLCSSWGFYAAVGPLRELESPQTFHERLLGMQWKTFGLVLDPSLCNLSTTIFGGWDLRFFWVLSKICWHCFDG